MRPHFDRPALQRNEIGNSVQIQLVIVTTDTLEIGNLAKADRTTEAIMTRKEAGKKKGR